MFSDKYAIRIESIGGFGANLIGKILGEIGAEYMNVEAQSFASYGSEKRGSPVKSYVRYSNSEIRINAPVRKPDLLGLFKLSLGNKENTLAGIGENRAVVINTESDFEDVVDKLKLPSCNLWLIDAMDIAVECKSRLNVVMLGAMVKASGFIPIEYAEEAVKNSVGVRYPDKLAGNLKALNMGYSKVRNKIIKNNNPTVEYKDTERVMGYDNSPIGGVNYCFANSVTNDLQGCREGFLPHYIREKCIDCGLCDSTCPDMVFQFDKGVNLGMDLYHCKGCLRCVEICPTQALVAVREGEFYDNIGNISLVNKDFQFNDVGENSWVDSESYNNKTE